MKVFTVTGFEGHWPVGTCAVIVARDRGHARRLLNAKLKTHGLEPVEDTTEFKLLDTSVTHAEILADGNY